MKRSIPLLCLLLLLNGCQQRGVDVPTAFQATAKNTDMPHKTEKSEKKAAPDHYTPPSEREQAPQHREKNKLEKIAKEIPDTIKKIPVIKDIPKVLPSAKEIPIVNKIAAYLSQRPRNSYKRLGKHAPIVAPQRENSPASQNEKEASKLFDYSQHFSGGLHYDEKVLLRKIEVKTTPETHTELKIYCSKITPYTIDYDAEKKVIIVMLKECSSNLKNPTFTLPKNGIIKASRIESTPEGTALILPLKQDAKIDVLESYDPTYISVDITPMYRLYIGNPS